MELIIEQSIKKQYPDLRIGILVARGIDNAGNNPQVTDLKKLKTDQFIGNFTLGTLRENVCIKAWQECYRSFGVNPKKKIPTAESLLTRLLKGSELPTISTVVDLYLTIETEFLLPVGGYDLDRVTGEILLKHSFGNECFFPIGGETEERTEPGEVVYADTEKILTRRWNYKDCDSTKITADSKNIILMSEAVSKEISTEHLEASFTLLRDYILTYCGGEVEIQFVDVKDTNITF